MITGIVGIDVARGVVEVRIEIGMKGLVFDELVNDTCCVLLFGLK